MPIAAAQLTLELHTQQFIDSLAGAPPIYTLSPADARAVLVRAQSVPVGKPSAQIQDMALPVGPSGSVAIRIVRPAGAAEVLPAVMYFHGGGWILGDRDTHDRLIMPARPKPAIRSLSSRLMPQPATWRKTAPVCASTLCALPLRGTA
jgi:acetyl esterase/lipase